MKNLFGKSWKTTLAGLASGIAMALADLYVSGGIFTAKTIVGAVVPIVIGALAKDAGVTGVEK